MSAALFGQAGRGIEQAIHGPEPLATVARVFAVVMFVAGLALAGYVGWVCWENRK